MKHLALFTFCIFLFSCSAEKRLARFQKRNPELFTKDTLHIHDTGSVQLKPTDTTALNQLDSLLNALMLEKNTDLKVVEFDHLKEKTGSESFKRNISSKIRQIYVEKPCIKTGDTLKYNVNDTFMVNIWQEGNRLRFSDYRLVTTEKANITEGKTPQWKNYLLIAGWILVAVLFLLLLIRR